MSKRLKITVVGEIALPEDAAYDNWDENDLREAGIEGKVDTPEKKAQMELWMIKEGFTSPAEHLDYSLTDLQTTIEVVDNTEEPCPLLFGERECLPLDRIDL